METKGQNLLKDEDIPRTHILYISIVRILESYMGMLIDCIDEFGVGHTVLWRDYEIVSWRW